MNSDPKNLPPKKSTLSRLLPSSLSSSVELELENIPPIIEEIESKSLEALVIDSRAELKRYLTLLDAADGRSSRAKAEKLIGYQERRAIKFLLASIDKNGDGIVVADEIDAYEERAKENVSKTQELLLNIGLVASVVLTISYPASILELNASDASVAFFAEPVRLFCPITIAFLLFSHISTYSTIIQILTTIKPPLLLSSSSLGHIIV